MERYTIKTKYGWQLKADLAVHGDVNTFNNAMDKLAELENAEAEGRLVILPHGASAPRIDELEDFVRCEDCIYGGWTDDATAHCNLWHKREDMMCVGYLGFCGAGTKGKMLEIEEAEAVLKERETND